MPRRVRFAALAFALAAAAPAAPVAAAWNLASDPAADIFPDGGPRNLNLRRTSPKGQPPAAGLDGPAVDSAVAAGALAPGVRPWTLQARLRLSAGNPTEGVLYAVETRPPGTAPLTFVVSASPAENAFIVRCLGRAGAANDAGAERVAFPNPSGPPQGEAVQRTLFLVPAEPLPRDRWFEAELTFAGATAVTLRIDGAPVAVAAIPSGIEPLPGGFSCRLMVGSDAERSRPFPGEVAALTIRATPGPEER